MALIREATVKSIILLSDKLSERILNNDLLRYLAKAQGDPEPSIRTNTCILLGRLGPTLGYNTKKKVLVPAFTRALKDPFVHCRVAGVMALMATIDCFEPEELATKVIPNMAFGMVDKEKLVRDQAFKAMELFVKRLEEHAASMPETAALENEGMPGFNLPPTSPGGTNTLVNSAAGAAGALAGWAISSLGKKVGPQLRANVYAPLIRKSCQARCWRALQRHRRQRTFAPHIRAAARIANHKRFERLRGHSRQQRRDRRAGEAARANALVSRGAAASEHGRHVLHESEEHASRGKQSSRELESI